jgi:hypothetical protein
VLELRHSAMCGHLSNWVVQGNFLASLPVLLWDLLRALLKANSSQNLFTKLWTTTTTHIGPNASAKITKAVWWHSFQQLPYNNSNQ